MDSSLNYFDEIVRLPDAYATLSTTDARSHHEAARNLYEQSVRFLDSLPIRPEDRVLDIGAGYGFHCAYFAQRGARVTGLAAHVTEQLVEHAKANGYEYRQADMHELDFPDESFDWVWSHHSLEHSYSPLMALREWYRVLARGGRLAVTVPPHKNDIVSGHFHTGWSVGQLLYVVGVAGYQLRGGKFLEEGYNVRGLATRPVVDLDPVGASWMFQLKERFPEPLQALMRSQPASLGKWNYPGRIQFLSDERCDLMEENL